MIKYLCFLFIFAIVSIQSSPIDVQSEIAIPDISTFTKIQLSILKTIQEDKAQLLTFLNKPEMIFGENSIMDVHEVFFCFHKR